jgi:hypothetical protein
MAVNVGVQEPPIAKRIKVQARMQAKAKRLIKSPFFHETWIF